MGALLPVTPAAVSAAESSGGELYLGGASIGGETVGGDDIDISFSDIVKNLDFALMGALAANRDRWTLFVDLIYLNVSDDESNIRSILGVPIETRVDVSFKNFISTFGGA